MMPINDAGRKLVIQAIENEIEQLSIELSIPLADRMDNDDELKERITSYQHLQRGLMENQLLIMNMRPQCMATEITSDPDRTGPQCTEHGKFTPLIVVYAKDGQTPLAQMDTNPPLRLCAKHSNGNVEQYLPKEKWPEIQAAVMQQTQQLVTFDDARIMFMDSESGQLVPPPSVSIARG